MPRIAVIGTTSWGVTLGVVLARKGVEVRLWARTEREAATLRRGRSFPERLPRVSFPDKLTVTSSMSEALANAGAVILVVPSQTMRQNIRLVRDYLRKPTLIISAAKGLEIGTNQRMSQVIAEEIDPHFHPNICVLSGPNLAREILNDLPAASVVAAVDEAVAVKAQNLLSTPNFSIYTNTDVIGVELGGALKNIVALGAGMVDGLNLGDNAKAAFITRGLTEMAALGVAMGASPLTLSGLAGLGDLIATCASPLSRNHYLGFELTKGRSLEEITKTMTGVAEGVSTTVAVWNLAKQLGLGMPITEKIYHILYENADPRQTIAELLGTRGKHELAGRKWRLSSLFRYRRRS
ncbi:MAG: NAD(P)-dependent glycerol-3-phosphate dehydrogenase [Dehalococcoidales bacterium]|nr:NAD(P)-dependent glycerol-3-phosphate dehydrogenase [Dehalococcoidales bacterium]